MLCVFFFKQKTAYEMRISDWSSDVCSSDLFDKLAEVKPNVRLWYRDEAQFEQALKSGEIPMGQYYHDVTGLAAADGHPERSTFPKERSEEHTSDLQSLMRISYAVFCL